MADDVKMESVKACYSTWSGSYYDDYYGEKASYPPVHRDILVRLLAESGARTVLDAGCGPASFLRDILGRGYELYGFDLTPSMVKEGRRIFAEAGLPPERIWEGSVLDPAAFVVPKDFEEGYDAAVCSGVLPHIPEESDAVVIENLRSSVRKGGLVALEARNKLFSLFTLNRYSHDLFLEELVDAETLRREAGDDLPNVEKALEGLKALFRTDQPPLRRGRASEPGYDEVLSRTHNPIELKELFAASGFSDVRVLFYHYHCLPPMFQSAFPRLFLERSLAMENPDDWRGYVMASAFILVGKRA